MKTRSAYLSDSTHKTVFHYTPRHASWLNQIEIWFSILVRRFLKRSSFKSTEDLNQQLAFIQEFAFAGQSDQKDKEMAATNRLFGILPEMQLKEMKALWLEFEKAETSDARYAKSMDCISPLLQNMVNEGGSWAKHNVSRQQAIKRNEYLKGLTRKLWDYALQQIDLAVEEGWLTP